MCIKVIRKKGVGDLPIGTKLEEVSVCCQLSKGTGQIVLPWGIVEQGKLFETSRNGEKIEEERFEGIKFITFIER